MSTLTPLGICDEGPIVTVTDSDGRTHTGELVWRRANGLVTLRDAAGEIRRGRR